MKSNMKQTEGSKVVACVYSDDNEPTWQDKLKNQMGYAATSNCADKVHGKHANRGVENAKQLLDDLGLKKSTESDRPEKAEDRINGD